MSQYPAKMATEPTTGARRGAAGRFLQEHWPWALRLREKLWMTEEAVQLAIAGVVGLVGGMVNVIFYLAIERAQAVLSGHPHLNIVQIAESMPPVWRFVTPALGGLAAGAVLFWGVRLAGRPRTTNLLEVVVAGDGRLPFRNGLVRSISSIISISTGASIGREGGITQLSATLASKWGQIMNWQPYRLRLLVGCGAAAGMAAAYNAPITGAIFAAHIVLGNFSMNFFAPLLFSSVVATVFSRSLCGIRQWSEMPAVEFTNMAHLPWFLVLGIMAGVMAAVFLKALRHGERLFKRVPSLPVRMAVGGMLVGAIALWYPEVWGNGYVVTVQIIKDPGPAKVLLAIILAKLVATTFSVGCGTVGGVITPTLFLGAGSGAFLWVLLDKFGMATEPAAVFALVGMASVFSATTRSPLLAIVMILELSSNYTLMPALMLACAVSTLVSHRLHPKSIYTEPVRLRALEVADTHLGSAVDQKIGDIMRSPVPPVRDNTALPQIAERFLGSQHNFIPVVEARGRLVGLVALHDLKSFLGGGPELNALIAADVMRPAPPCLRPGQKLIEALPTLLASEQRNVPVVNTLEEQILIGAVVRVEALGLLSEAIAERNSTTASPEFSRLPAADTGSYQI